MKMRIYFLLAALLTLMPVWAREITCEQAQIIANDFFKGNCEKVDLFRSDFAPIKAIGQSSKPEFHIFNLINNDGFVIVSGEDTTPAILGFGTTGHIAADSIPDNLASHLDCLRQQIAYARRTGTGRTSKSAGPTSETGTRLLTPAWNQFEQMTPEHVPAGCVPTAMAIIMGAWHWPISGEGISTNTGEIYGSEGYYDITLDHNVEFNLDKLPFEISKFADLNPDQQFGLANLVLHTGTAVEVHYGTYSAGGSGAYVYKAREALIDHFKFSDDMPELKYDQSMSTIEQTLREELAAGRPVIYSAQSSTSGHAFVCDGVWDDYFHFNLGWGGFGNGYYLLNAIDANPNHDGFNYDAYILSNIHPRTSEPDYTPRQIPIVYDELPDEQEEPVTTSSDYSPIEFSSKCGYGLVSPYSSYKKGEAACIYYSGLNLTGRFDDSADWVASLTDGYIIAELGVAIVDGSDNILDFFEIPYEQSIWKENTDQSIYYFAFEPTVDVKPEYRILMYAKIQGQDVWKQIKGLSDVSSELSCAAPSSQYLPYNIRYDSSSFSLVNIYGQISDKVVLGQKYYLYFVSKKPMESAEITNHGQPISFSEDSFNGDMKTFSISLSVDSPEGIDVAIEPLDKSQTDIAVHLDNPATLQDKLKNKATKIRNLTISGEMNIFDLQYLNTPTFSQIKKLDLSKATISEYSPLHKANCIPDYFFYNHININEISLPEGLKDLGTFSFSYCWGLSKITIPATLASIPENGLMYCPFCEVINKCPVPQEINEFFVSDLAENSILYVPIGSKTVYENHPYWSRFSSIIEKNFTEVENLSAVAPYTITKTGNIITINGAPDDLPVRIYAISGQLLWSGISADISKYNNLPDSPIIIVTPKLTLKMN